MLEFTSIVSNIINEPKIIIMIILMINYYLIIFYFKPIFIVNIGSFD